MSWRTCYWQKAARLLHVLRYNILRSKLRKKDAVKTAVQEFDLAFTTQPDNEVHINEEPGIFYLDDDDEIDENWIILGDDEYGDMLQEP